MPLIKEEILAACQTEAQLETKITELLKEYIREPQVTVQIKEYQSEPVAVLGAVRAPSRFQLQRRVRLLELLTFVNGPADNAGRTIQVVHTGPRMTCDCRLPREIRNRSLVQLILTNSPTLCAARTSRILTCSRATLFRSRSRIRFMLSATWCGLLSIALTEPMTVSRAMAMAGGTALDTKKNAIHLIRQTPGTTEKKEIVIDLDAINRHKAEDVVLVANDIIEVPGFGRKEIPPQPARCCSSRRGPMPVRVIP